MVVGHGPQSMLGHVVGSSSVATNPRKKIMLRVGSFFALKVVEATFCVGVKTKTSN